MAGRPVKRRRLPSGAAVGDGDGAAESSPILDRAGDGSFLSDLSHAPHSSKGLSLGSSVPSAQGSAVADASQELAVLQQLRHTIVELVDRRGPCKTV
eukprot:4720181-Pleurochrysis_carterae.AAC.8